MSDPDDKHVLTALRLQYLRAIAANPRAATPANLTRWFVEHGYVVVTEPARRPRPDREHHRILRKLPARAKQVTAAGLAAIAEDDKKRAALAAERRGA